MDTTYVDRMLRCRDCGDEFVFSAGEQAFYASKGLVHDPARCPSCRAILRGQRAAAALSQRTARDQGSPAPDRRGSAVPSPRVAGRQAAPARRLFAAVCSMCGSEALVPFVPRGDRPVYCSACYAQSRQPQG